MSYSLFWRSPALPYTQKQTAIVVAAGVVVSNAASIRFTGKGSANYGKVQQENMMRLLENSAGDTAPDYPTVGQCWYDTSVGSLKVCISTAPSAVAWRACNGVQVTNVGDPAPSPANLGDMWFQRTGASSGILFAYTGVGRYPESSGVIGGWAQVYPGIDRAASRNEYDYMNGLLLELIGDPTTYGGSNARGTSIQYMNNLAALDSSTQTAWSALTPHDINVLDNISLLTSLEVEPNSQDWDTLLAAAKYAVNRLELPVSLYADVSDLPFVQDGRPAPASLLALSSSSVQYPSNQRRAGRRAGMVTLVPNYAATSNVLNAAIENRYMLAGIMGTSGTNPVFASGVSTVDQATFSANAAGTPFGTTVTHGLLWRFTNTLGFFTAAQALTVILTHAPSGSPTSADTSLKAITDAFGRIRVTADATYVMDSSSTPALAMAPGTTGYLGITTPGVTLATLTSGGVTVTIRGQLSGSNVILYVDINAGGATTGTFTAAWKSIQDTETYGASVRVYPIPSAYTGTDKQGSGLFS